LGVWLIEVDTHPWIQQCITESLLEQSLMASFVSHLDQVCHDAASEQDEIGWQNFVEGKISKSWGDLQLEYYHELHSKCSVDIWTSGLVSHLLEVTHGMWIHRNGVNHAVDEQGLPFCLSWDVETAIHKKSEHGGKTGNWQWHSVCP
jgi:hypothetical protein